MKKAMFTLLTAFAAVAWVSAGTTSPENPLVIKKASAAPAIDGAGDDEVWTIADWVDVGIKKGTAATSGFAGKFKMLFDDNNIYVLVSVNDPTPNKDHETSWQADCVELFFAMDTNSHASYQPGDWQIRKRAAVAAPDGIDGGSGIAEKRWNVSVLLDDPNFVVEQVDGTPYVQEWQLPINTLKQDANFDGENFRFEIQCADNEDGSARSGQLFWNSGADDQWDKVINHGYVKMDKSSAIKNVAKASSIRIKANSIEFAKSVKEVNVYSITGQLILKAQNVNAISTSALKSGVYFVVADGEKAKFVIK